MEKPNFQFIFAVMKAYERFARVILEEGFCDDSSHSFTDACRRAKASPSDINELLEEELGLSGEEFCLFMKDSYL